MKRRDFVKLSGLVAGVSLIPVREVQADPVPLKGDDPQAKALGYVEVSTTAGSHCNNCAQATGDLAAEWVGCNVFPGKQVKGAGWCKVWMPRPQ